MKSPPKRATILLTSQFDKTKMRGTNNTIPLFNSSDHIVSLEKNDASDNVIPAKQCVRKCPKLVIPAQQSVRKCPEPVIPAQAGIQKSLFINDIKYTLYCM